MHRTLRSAPSVNPESIAPAQFIIVMLSPTPRSTIDIGP
jgi:hypothetical protein